MLNQVKQDTETRMKKSLETLTAEFAKIRTGRAHPSLLDHIMVNYYGTDMPLGQVASVSINDPRTLLIVPWEKPMVPVIEKAIIAANLGFNPTVAGQDIRVPLPPLTEERRKEMIKIVKGEAENARVAIRNIRRDSNTQLKNLLKDKKISEDEEKNTEEAIQKLTDKYVAEVDRLLAVKEKDLLEV